jgi:hypothetical protein
LSRRKSFLRALYCEVRKEKQAGVTLAPGVWEAMAEASGGRIRLETSTEGFAEHGRHSKYRESNSGSR